MRDYILISIIGYLFGCLQFAFLLGKIYTKKDIRTLGHGNAGASNVAVSIGWKPGAMVALLDIGKAIVSVLLIKSLFPDLIHNNYFPLFLNGSFVVLGHTFPFYLNFKGGKGTASTTGMLLAINLNLGLISMLITFLATVISDYIAIGALVLWVYILSLPLFLPLEIDTILLNSIMATIILIKHIPNLKRIKNKEEKGLRNALKSKKANQSG